ncbi:MAG TPA: hypothetical protein VMU16_03710 [Candidatus Binataceae bacterium]|nr:hypothetical protein [Candidatus Binataceae bacterium]
MIAALAVTILIGPSTVRADEWERVPAGGGGYGGSYGTSYGGGRATAMTAPTARRVSDIEAVNTVRDQMGGTQDPCEVVGLLAAVAATARDQGLPKERQFDDMDCTFSRALAGTHVGFEWSHSFETLMTHEINYVYAHPEVGGAQMMAHWTRICESPNEPAPVTAEEQPQQNIESLPTP